MPVSGHTPTAMPGAMQAPRVSPVSDSTHPTDSPRLNGAAALLGEVETAVALMGVGKVTAVEAGLYRVYANTKRSHERALDLLPAYVQAMTHEQEVAVWNRLGEVREWLESTGSWLRMPR